MNTTTPPEVGQTPTRPLLHFVAVKNGMEFHYTAKTEYEARTQASQELGTCSDFYQVFISESGTTAGV